MNKNLSKKKGGFVRFSSAVASAAGSPWTFVAALSTVLLWAVLGPAFGFSDTWQLVINTGTTIITFLMVFLIQNTQNRDSQALQIKLDELIRATDGAHTALIELEELTDLELCEIRQGYAELAEQGRKSIRQGDGDTGTPEIIITTFSRKEEDEDEDEQQRS